jgi:hypothetical protein
LSAEQHRELSERGWTLTHTTVTDAKAFSELLLTLAAGLGVPIAARRGEAIVSVLRPTVATEARPNSLSASYSTGAFPFHIDTAHWIVPCRYIVIGCFDAGEGDRKTLLLDRSTLPLSNEQNQLLLSVPLRVINGRQSFFSTIAKRGRPFVRYDPGCMRATTEDGERAMAVYSDGAWTDRTAEVCWTKGNVLVIDNWRVLHGRSETNVPDAGRMLMRVYAKGGDE